METLEGTSGCDHNCFGLFFLYSHGLDDTKVQELVGSFTKERKTWDTEFDWMCFSITMTMRESASLRYDYYI